MTSPLRSGAVFSLHGIIFGRFVPMHSVGRHDEARTVLAANGILISQSELELFIKMCYPVPIKTYIKFHSLTEVF